MKALSIRQPWALLVTQGGKDIENRTWPTKFRGRVLIHAAKGMTRAEYDAMFSLLVQRDMWFPHNFPYGRLQFDALERGGIIGSVEIVDCVSQSDSPWFTGPYGFVLANPEPMPFTPLRGMLGFFEVDQKLLPSACACKKRDAWRCAVEQGLRTVSCHCACHRSKNNHG